MGARETRPQWPKPDTNRGLFVLDHWNVLRVALPKKTFWTLKSYCRLGPFEARGFDCNQIPNTERSLFIGSLKSLSLYCLVFLEQCPKPHQTWRTKGRHPEFQLIVLLSAGLQLRRCAPATPWGGAHPTTSQNMFISTT